MMDVDRVARRLGTSVRHVRRLVAERRIPFHKIGGKLRFDPANIDEWVAASLVPPHEEPAWLTPIAQASASHRSRQRSVTAGSRTRPRRAS